MPRTYTSANSVIFENEKQVIRKGEQFGTPVIHRQNRNCSLEEIGKQLEQGLTYDPKRWDDPAQQKPKRGVPVASNRIRRKLI